MMDDSTMSNQTGKLTEKQREILMRQKKELRGASKTNMWITIIGILLCLTLIGLPFGMFLILYAIYRYHGIKRKFEEIEFQLAGE